ncbi:unnamed protein product [Staurois parvus]|uniref:Uncharacterized protein n=1 Tax=Staurois parvus TaxID=386267 RepID=A0ABN9F651_9NEOB|nr:unnamed protein product [Staurois parvus]
MIPYCPGGPMSCQSAPGVARNMGPPILLHSQATRISFQPCTPETVNSP